MLRLYINNDFDFSGLIPNLANIIKHLNSVDIECESVVFGDLDELKKNIFNSNPFIRCDLNFGTSHVGQMSMAPESVRFHKTFDSLTLENNSWVPRLRYFDILRRKIVTQFGSIEIKESAGLVSDSEAPDALVAVLVSLGFKKILLFRPDGSEDIGPRLCRYFIGIDVQTIPFSVITQNQDSTSIIVNAVDLERNSVLMNDLAYFNFMSPKGIIVDLASKTPIHPLLFEAEKAGLRVLKRRDVVSAYDYESLKLIWADVETSKDEFFGNYLEIETIDQ